MSFWSKYVPDSTVYILTDEDTGFSYEWRFKAPSFAAERKIAQELRRLGGGTFPDTIALELAATFAGTTFPAPESPTLDPSNGSYVAGLADNATPEQVIAFLDTIPPHIVNALWEKVSEVAPNWGPQFPRRN
jgi:hypothetical protein